MPGLVGVDSYTYKCNIIHSFVNYIRYENTNDGVCLGSYIPFYVRRGTWDVRRPGLSLYSVYVRSETLGVGRGLLMIV